ncbi:hypothetical protein QTP70_004439, partial [Hemibagrus guttatus]
CDALGVKSWSALDSTLRSGTSNLRELHLTVKTLKLSWNNLGDSGVKSLSAVLENPHCKLENTGRAMISYSSSSPWPVCVLSLYLVSLVLCWWSVTVLSV